MKRKLTKTEKFTLIELLVVVAMIGIFTYSAPGTRSLIKVQLKISNLLIKFDIKIPLYHILRASL